MLTDRAIGSMSLAIGTAFMIYYVIWMVEMPFVDSEHFSQALFPPKVYGLILPSVLGGVLITAMVVVGSLHGIFATAPPPQWVLNRVDHLGGAAITQALASGHKTHHRTGGLADGVAAPPTHRNAVFVPSCSSTAAGGTASPLPSPGE